MFYVNFFRSVYLFAGENGILLALFEGIHMDSSELRPPYDDKNSLVAAHRHITYHDPKVQCSFKY